MVDQNWPPQNWLHFSFKESQLDPTILRVVLKPYCLEAHQPYVTGLTLKYIKSNLKDLPHLLPICRFSNIFTLLLSLSSQIFNGLTETWLAGSHPQRRVMDKHHEIASLWLAIFVYLSTLPSSQLAQSPPFYFTFLHHLQLIAPLRPLFSV